MAKRLQTILSFLIIICALIIYIKDYKTKKDNFLKNDLIISEKINTNTYYAILEIPKIKLKRELYPIDSKENNVNKNLMLIKKSTFPDTNPSNVIIAGHSGNASNAYFKDLYKLEINDTIKLYYDGYIYYYSVKKIDAKPKTGTLYLDINYNNMLTLITCTKNNNKTQTIYYSWLKKLEKI